MRNIADLYRLAYQFGIHGPDHEGTPWPTLPQATSRANTALLFDANGLPTVGVFTQTVLTQALWNAFYQSSTLVFNVFATPAEIAAGLSINTAYFLGDLRRYGIVPNNVGAASNNTSILRTLVNRNVPNGPTYIYSTNTGGAAVPDTYYFNDFVQVRDFCHIDLQGCTWSCTKTPVDADSSNGFLFILTGVVIENGSINLTLNSGGSTSASCLAIFMGARGVPVVGSPLPTVYDSTWVHNLGNIVLRDLNINCTTGSAGQMACIYANGGLYNVSMENLWLDGGSTCGFGIYYEFGYANSDGP